MNISPAVRRAHLETQRRLLDAEHDAQERLAAAAQGVLDANHGATPAALRKASDEARDRVAAEVERLRGEARAAGRSTLAHEFRVGADSAGRRGLARVTLASTGPTLADQIAGRRAGNDYAAAWLTRATVDGPVVATKTTRYRLHALGGAEIGQAFGAEREAAMRQFARAIGPELHGTIVLAKVWDARLDACPKCRDLDGQIRPMGISFRGGVVPGGVHRRCRCIGGALVLPAVTMSEAA